MFYLILESVFSSHESEGKVVVTSKKKTHNIAY